MAAPRLYPTQGGRWHEVGTIRNRRSTVLDGSGNGSVQFDVRSSNNKYIIEDVVMESSQSSTTPPYPTATAYAGAQQVGLMEGATWTGNQDIMRGHVEMDACTDLIVAFTGGLAGSTLTVIIEGKNYLWR